MDSVAILLVGQRVDSKDLGKPTGKIEAILALCIQLLPFKECQRCKDVCLQHRLDGQ